jgi:hypothetical protein
MRVHRKLRNPLALILQPVSMSELQCIAQATDASRELAQDEVMMRQLSTLAQEKELTVETHRSVVVMVLLGLGLTVPGRKLMQREPALTIHVYTFHCPATAPPSARPPGQPPRSTRR